MKFKRIDNFSGQYRFLSNFYPCVITYGIVEYPTVEHAYQALKTNNVDWRERIRKAATPAEAKRLGSRCPIRDEWKEKRIRVMTKLVKQKFTHEPLRQKLIATGKAELIEGNYWGDTFWGVCHGIGENQLGRILMALRDNYTREK